MSKAEQFDGAGFDNAVLAAEQPVLVDFYADWCGPCRVTGPIVDQLAEEYGGRVKVGKVNVDSEPELAQRYQIRAVPTLLVFRGGEVVKSVRGAVPKNVLAAHLDAALVA